MAVSSPVVSVITPSYNQGPFITDTIESVRRQSYDHIEHIVVDGGSTDDTLEILESYDHLDWVSEPDDGQADAINNGVEMASGSIVAWLNTDDVYLHTDTVESVVAAFDEMTDVVYGDMAYMNTEATIKYLFCPRRFDYERFSQNRISMPPQATTFFDASVFADRPLDQSLEFVFDYEFWARNGEELSALYLDRPISGYRHHDESKSIATPAGFDHERERIDREYGFRDPAPTERLVDIATSGLPRRLRSVRKIVRLRRTLKRRGTVSSLSVPPAPVSCVSTALQDFK